MSDATPHAYPWVSRRSAITIAGQLVILVTDAGKRYLIELHPGRRFYTNLGHLEHSDLIGQPLGTTVYSQIGHPMLLMEPSLSDLMTRIKRNTQIIYPKDAAYLIHRLSLRAGSHVIEAGTGSRRAHDCAGVDDFARRQSLYL